MQNWSEGDIRANGITLHYHRSGTVGKPILLLLHGITDSGQVWTRVVGDLGADYDIVMPDARGHGKSADLSSGFSPVLLADDVAEIITGLGLQKPYVWGHSMGAITAAIMASHYPDLVSAVVLEDPPLFATMPEAPTPPAPPATEPDFRAMSVAERLATAKAINPTWHPDELPPWAESKAQVDPSVIHYRHLFRSYPWRDALARMECPTLLLTGSIEAGALITPEIEAEALSLLKHGQVLQLIGSGHNIHRDRYDTTIRAVHDFLLPHKNHTEDFPFINSDNQ